MIENLASISEESAASTEEISATMEQNLASVQNMGQEIGNLAYPLIDRAMLNPHGFMPYTLN